MTGPAVWPVDITDDANVGAGTFARLLRSLRLAAGLTQERLAAKAGISPRAISYLETGRISHPQLATIDALAEALTVDPAVRQRLRADAGRSGNARPAIVPHQLPADIDDFTGRESVSDLACEVARAAHNRPTILMISGVAGVGKTAVAVHVAQRLRTQFPDGQLYLRLRGSGSVALSIEEALGHLLRGIGSSEPAIHETVDERSARYRSLIASRRLLIVLDDASSAAQVRPLLPGTLRCLVLVTSRNRLVGLEGARRLVLEPMAPAEAQALLVRVLGRERTATEQQAVQTVARLCGYMPLALRIVAARLAARPPWRISDMAKRLAERRRRLDELVAEDLNVRATFELTYNGLAPEQAQAFRLLAASDLRDLSIRACAALTGLPADRAEAMAESLVDMHLLESPQPGRYRLHDLLKLFASEKLEQDQTRQAAVNRLHTSYRFMLRAAVQLTRPGLVPSEDRTTNPHFVDADAARRWLDDEYGSIVTLIIEATSNDSIDCATDLLRDIQGRLRTGGHWHAWERAAQAVLDAANPTGDHQAALVAHQHLGQIATLRGRFADAEDALQRGLALARRLDDRAGEASALNRLGLLEFARSRVQEAIAHHEQAYRICISIGDKRGAYTALTNLGNCRIDNDDATGAMAAIEAGLAMAEDAGDNDAITLLVHQEAKAQAALGNHSDAIRTHLRNLTLIRKRGLREGEAYTLLELGKSYLAVNRANDAAQALELSLAIFQALDAPVATRSCWVELGRAQLRLNLPKQAQATLRRAQALLEPFETQLQADVEDLLRDVREVA